MVDDQNSSAGRHWADHGSDRPKEIDSDALFAGQSEIHIRHGEDLYRLRTTSKGKLILTK